MRTEKVKLFGTHFFCVLITDTFSTHMDIDKIAWQHMDVTIPLHCRKDKRSLKGQVEGSFHRSKRSSHRSTVSENQEPSTPDNELEPPINSKDVRWRLET